MACGFYDPGATGAGHYVSQQLDRVEGVARSAIADARDAASAMQAFTFEPIQLPTISFGEVEYDGFVKPPKPTASFDPVQKGDKPEPPDTVPVSTEGFDQIDRPDWQIPDAPDISMPASPQLVTPQRPGPPPSFVEVGMPEYEGQELPPVPELSELNIPDAPDVSFDDFDVERPEFHLPEQYVYDNNFVGDTKELEAYLRERYAQWDTDGTKMRERWAEMLVGGTGLPSEIEQAIFDRGIGREDVSSEQAVKQAQGEWAARGFSLPGSTLLARESEVRRQNRIERGRINREILVQAHTQEIENMRFAIEQGAALEGQRAQFFAQMIDSARGIISGYYDVARALFTTHVELLRAQIEVYQADISAFRERVQIELSRLEAFRTQIEAERIRGEINQQRVELYRAQLQGVLANVDVFRAEIEGANAQIRAQVNQMDLHRSRIDAYRSEWEGERIKFDVYNTRVNAEESRTRLYQAQIQAFSERVTAYRTEVEAEAAKVGAKTDYNNAVVRQYGVEADAWGTEVNASIARLQAQVQEYNALVSMYNAEVTGERARVEGEARNTQLAIELARAKVAAELKKADQKIAQLELAERLGLEALKGSAQTNTQLAASALSAVSLSAGVQDSVTRSRSHSSGCQESYSGQI